MNDSSSSEAVARGSSLRHAFLAACSVLSAAVAAGVAAGASHPIARPPVPEGTLSFRLGLEQPWRNGAGRPRKRAEILRIPGLASARLRQDSTAVALHWRWETGGPNHRTQVAELRAPETYVVQVTWDARGGRFNFYVNGMSMRAPGTRYEPWELSGSPREVVVGRGPVRVSHIEVSPVFLTEEAARRAVPEKFLGRHADLFGLEERPPPEPLPRKGRLLIDVPMAGPDDVRDWTMEGPGEVDFEGGWMRMRSARPDAPRGVNGHIVFWHPEDLPASFVAEWDVQIVSEYGLSIVFFAARGVNGEDIFDPRLPKRDGTFVHYIKGAVRSYHISYFAHTPGLPGRGTCNLRKNNRFYLVSNGPPVIGPDDRAVHRVRLTQDGPHILLQIDGRVVIDYTDPGTERFGPVHRGGKIGLRQMQWTAARYRDLRVWELKDER